MPSYSIFKEFEKDLPFKYRIIIKFSRIKFSIWFFLLSMKYNIKIMLKIQNKPTFKNVGIVKNER